MNTTDLPQFPDVKPFEIQDRQAVNRFLDRFNVESCEYSFTNLFCWQNAYPMAWTVYQDRLVILNKRNGSFLMPVGEFLPPEDLFILSAMIQNGCSTSEITSVPQRYLDEHPAVKGYYTISKQRDHADYIYSAEKLAELKGKKLHKKKNQISQFERRYPQYRVESIQGDMIRKCRDFANELFARQTKPPESLVYEHDAITNAFRCFDQLGLEGQVLLIGDRPAAFSLYSRLTPETYDIHFEKADLLVKGAAQVINHEVAKRLKNRCTFINREQDLGVPGLRKAKLSYDPVDIRINATLHFTPADTMAERLHKPFHEGSTKPLKK